MAMGWLFLAGTALRFACLLFATGMVAAIRGCMRWMHCAWDASQKEATQVQATTTCPKEDEKPVATEDEKHLTFCTIAALRRHAATRYRIELNGSSLWHSVCLMAVAASFGANALRCCNSQMHSLWGSALMMPT